MPVSYSAPQEIVEVIRDLGRTEDVRFSPNNQRLAIAGFANNIVAVFDIAISACGPSKAVTLKHVTKISSSELRRPHGLDFIDDATIIVANREGDTTVFRLPAPGRSGSYQLTPVQVIRSGQSPGSVSISKKGSLFDVLICQNYEHRVTRSEIDDHYSLRRQRTLIAKWLDVPDGVTASEGTEWIAVSNHNGHCVFIYEDDGALNESSHPVGLLRGVYCPHGVRFSSRAHSIIVADAGAPYVRIYKRNGESWRGVHNPVNSIRVLTDADFIRGRHNPLEGGPKGIDIDKNNELLVVTCECQPLAFFDLADLLSEPTLSAAETQSELTYELDLREKLREARRRAQAWEQRALTAETSLTKSEAGAREVRAQLSSVTRSKSWRITAPLRRLASLFRA